MKRVAGPSRSSKSDDIIVLDDEPPVKKEAGEKPEVAALKQEFKQISIQSEENFRELCNTARRDNRALQARVKELEALIGTKDGIQKATSKASVDNGLKRKKLGESSKELENFSVEGLKNKISGLEDELEESQLREAVQRAQLGDMSKELAEERKRSAELQQKLYPIDIESWELACICGQKEEDGEKMVACGQCEYRWEHVDCIFPETKQVPPGKYLCHTCLPRPTDLTPEQARAYQNRVQAVKDRQYRKEYTRQRKLARKREEALEEKLEKNSRKLSSLVVGSVPFRIIDKNEYSDSTRRLIEVYRSTGRPSADEDKFQKAFSRFSPRVRSVVVDAKIQGLYTNRNIPKGSYIAELCGYISKQPECGNRDILPGQWVNDCTFLFGTLLIDARMMGNVTRYLRRSCKPNAELIVIFSSSDLHVMIKLKDGVELRKMQEVSIAFEDDWKQHPRPAQGCACKGDELKTCEIELFFKQYARTIQTGRRAVTS